MTELSPIETATILQEGASLLTCEQGDTRTLADNHKMVAYLRTQREGEFKLVADKPASKLKERVGKKLTKTRYRELYNLVAEGAELGKDEKQDFEHNKEAWEAKVLVDIEKELTKAEKLKLKEEVA